MSAIRPLRLFMLACLLATPAAYADDAKIEAKGNADSGKDLFMTKSCAACHGTTKGDNMKVGPTLFGVLGRTAGTTPSMLGASENLKKYGVTWNLATLNEFLTDPNAKVPGTPMSGILPDAQERADVIAYLSTLKD